MTSKKTILISFLGTGSARERQYRKAKYSIDGKVLDREVPFVSSLISEHFQVDKQLIIGTTKSMWEELYRYTCEQKYLELDEDFYVSLSDEIQTKNHQSALDFFDTSKIEAVLGNDSKCVMIPYGLNEPEQQIIFNRIEQALEEILENDFEIILDITHSFRSLPLFSTSVISYLNNVKDKRNKIVKVLYGMLDAIGEFDGVAPIVDITNTVTLNNWSTAAHAFKEYGKGYMLADLLGGKEADMIRIFSDAVGINYMSEIQTRLSNFQQLSNAEIENEFGKRILPQVLKSFTQRLQKAGNKQYHFQFELAKWHYEIHNYDAAYLVFVESIISYVCHLENLEWKQQKNREEAKKRILKHKDLKAIYEKVNVPRTNIAHNLSKRPDSMKKDIEMLEEKLKEFEKIIKDKK
jgi:CRISPR-associated Csx2 family protein